MTASVHCFGEDQDAASRLAAALGTSCHVIDVHTFPDGEILTTVASPGRVVIAYCRLDRPNSKLVNLLLACDAWRRAGAERLVLVAPYMPYLRQDAVFAPGQALSRDVIGQILGAAFAHIVTVEPHLHRTPSLSGVFAPAGIQALSAAPALAGAIGPADAPVIVGPDVESEPWARAVAEQLAAPHFTLSKKRHGDRRVELTPPAGLDVRDRRVVLVDDICSTGATLEAAAILMSALGAGRVEVLVAHALSGEEATERFSQAGVARMVSTDSCIHPSNSAELTFQLAAALFKEIVR